MRTVDIASVVCCLTFLLFLLSSPHLSFSDPNEIGGLYWIVCLVLGQTTSFVALYFYLTEGSAKSLHGLWALLGATEAGFVIFFSIFIGAMAAKYRVTFFSTTTAKKFGVKAFRESLTDQNKMNILKLHPSYYKSIRDEVKQWAFDNYETWKEEKPEWFTERVKEKIPKDMIPESEE